VFFVVTVAAGIGAPDGSVTMPLMLAELERGPTATGQHREKRQ